MLHILFSTKTRNLPNDEWWCWKMIPMLLQHAKAAVTKKKKKKKNWADHNWWYLITFFPGNRFWQRGQFAWKVKTYFLQKNKQTMNKKIDINWSSAEDYKNPSWVSMQDREITPEGLEFQPGRGLPSPWMKLQPQGWDFPILHGLAHDGFFFSHL